MGTQTMLRQKRNQQCKPISTFGLLPLSGLQRIWERHERKWNEKKMLEIKGQNQRKDIKGILPTYLIEVLIKNLKNNKR